MPWQLFSSHGRVVQAEMPDHILLWLMLLAMCSGLAKG
jgi:hypothetical protein